MEHGVDVMKQKVGPALLIVGLTLLPPGRASELV